MSRFGKHKWWFVALTISVPALAWASVPNMFSAGEVLSSSQMNANFAALDQRLSAVESKLTPPTSVTTLSSATVVLPNAPGPLPLTSTIFSTTAGGGLLVIVTATSFVASGNGPLDVQVQLDSAPLGDLNVYANNPGFHEPLPTMVFPVPSPTPGTHTVTLVNGTNSTTNDPNDVFSVTVVRLGS